MTCERCGKEISANTAICPSCGTVVQPPTTYGQYSSKEYGDDQPIPTYDHGISPQVDFEAPHSAIYSSPPKQDCRMWRLKVYLRSEEHTSELQSRVDLVCRLLLEKKKNKTINT